jgi:predicted RNA binding protein YcfA (HicA-like mRNA interferase family)
VKLPRDLSGQRVVQALKRLGFIQERQEGSHIRLARGSLRVTVPAHRVLAPKTLQAFCGRLKLALKNSWLFSDKFVASNLPPIQAA